MPLIDSSPFRLVDSKLKSSSLSQAVCTVTRTNILKVQSLRDSYVRTLCAGGSGCWREGLTGTCVYKIVPMLCRTRARSLLFDGFFYEFVVSVTRTEDHRRRWGLLKDTRGPWVSSDSLLLPPVSDGLIGVRQWDEGRKQKGVWE